MATKSSSPMCASCKHWITQGCHHCPNEDNKPKKMDKHIRTQKISLPPSTLPPKTKRIKGRRYRLISRHENKYAATDRVKFLRQQHQNRIGYSLRIVALPRSQWGAVPWDIMPFALYGLYGHTKRETQRGLNEIFE